MHTLADCVGYVQAGLQALAILNSNPSLPQTVLHNLSEVGIWLRARAQLCGAPSVAEHMRTQEEELRAAQLIRSAADTCVLQSRAETGESTHAGHSLDVCRIIEAQAVGDSTGPCTRHSLHPALQGGVHACSG